MKLLKTIMAKTAPFMSTTACAVALFSLGSNCRTFLYQPEVPKALKEKE